MKLLLSEDRFDTSNIGIVAASNNTKQMEYLVALQMIVADCQVCNGWWNESRKSISDCVNVYFAETCTV